MSSSETPPSDPKQIDELVEPEVLDLENEIPDADGDAEQSAPTTTLVPSSDPRSVEAVDALTAYMSKLGQHAPITREEEHELAVKWIEEGDVEAARKLVLANLRLVVKIAMEYRRAWTNALDLIQEGNVGLVQATHRFDPYRGVKLSSYAAYWIRAYILKYILDNFRSVRMGTTRAQRKLFFQLNKEKRRLEIEGFKPEPKLIAERLDVSEDDVRDMDRRLHQSDLSLNAPAYAEDSTAEVGDFISMPSTSAEEDVATSELHELFAQTVDDFKQTLEDRDLQILEERLLAEPPKTLQELANEFGVSRERVRQVEARLIKRLREHFKNSMVDFDFHSGPDE